MSALSRINALAVLGLILSLGACQKAPEPQPQASIRDIMISEVDPSADALWASVGSSVTAAGTVDHRPQSDADWQTVRRYAITLTEAPNLLVIPGRKVAGVGQTTDDSGTPGIQKPDVIQAQIAANRPRFERLANGLQLAGLKALKAVDAKDPAALIDAGAALDEACEACHRTYWYPNSPEPKAPPLGLSGAKP
ncbi:MAG TPA: hypothetical protein VG960_11835 [Caulobacteraceae bacterium]|nr:hypothetical protein [Caulobacteraceae bacterium]